MFLIVTFAGIAYLAARISAMTQSANAIDVDLVDFKCFGMFNSYDNNIDNGVTYNSQDNPVTIRDSFNPGITQTCGNNDGSTSINNTSTCAIGTGAPDIAPSTIGLS